MRRVTLILFCLLVLAGSASSALADDGLPVYLAPGIAVDAGEMLPDYEGGSGRHGFNPVINPGGIPEVDPRP